MSNKQQTNGYDANTFKLIRQLALVRREQPKRWSEVDQEFYDMLVNKEIDYKQIQNEKEKCRESTEYFIDTYIQVKNKFENPDSIPEILKQRVVKDRIKFVMYDIQRELVAAIVNDDKVISTKSRQIGFTTTALACSVQLMTFHNNKTILLFSKSEKDAKDTLTELKFMYDNLPFFLRRIEYKRNEKELQLGTKMNASKIIAQTTGKSSGRSHAATQLICDEADYIQSIEDIYKAALFTIAATKGKIIVLSTPNMHGSWFQRMVKGAKNKENGFALIEGYQFTIPWRTQEWYDEQCALLNHDKKAIATELDMKQILPYDTYFDENKILSIKNLDPKDIISGSVDQFHKVKEDHNYIISVDCQEEGSHYNAVVVFDLEDYNIAASQLTRMNVFDTLIMLSNEYNNAKIMIERNRGFYLIKKFEENNLDHLLLPNIRYVAKTDKYEFDLDNDGKPNKLGFVTLKNTRNKLLTHLSDFIYKSTALPRKLLEEAQTFVIKRGKAVGLENDDLLMATGIGLLTAAVIEETRLNSKTDRKLRFLINLYQGEQLEKGHRNKQKELKETISGQISNMQRVVHSTIGNITFDHIEQLKMLQKLHDNDGGVSKIGKALSALYRA